MRLIQASHSFRGFPPLEPTDALNQARIWDGFGLHVVPEDALAPAFTRALEKLEDGALFGAPQIRDAWQELEREQKSRYIDTPYDPRYCEKCRDLSGLYWDEVLSKYRCCECPGGRTKAAAIWQRK